MSQHYDVATKDLIESKPADWPAFFGHPVSATKVSVIDADVSVISAEADKVIRIEERNPWILHLEFQASRDVRMARRLLRYNALLQHRHDCPVASVVFLLRPQANDSHLSGIVSTLTPIVPTWGFGYRVVRVWEESAESFLQGGFSAVPFAPIADCGKMKLQDVIDQMKQRFHRDTKREERQHLWAATYLMMGLRFDAALIDTVMKGVQDMEESTTYQALLERGEKKGMETGVGKGRIAEAREIVIRLGSKKFGSPTRTIRSKVEREADLSRLNAMIDQLLEAESWSELLAAGANS